MTMSTRTTLILGAILALASAQTLAHRGSGGKFPASYDLDGDGTVTEEEIQTARTAEFAKIDTGGDGTISIAEAQTWLDSRLATEFASLDADQNGSLSQAEFVGSQTGRKARLAAKAFKFGDSNGDGALSLAEFKADKPVARELTRMFAMHDTDDDDQISQAEYLTPPAHLLRRGPGEGGGPGGRGPGR
jgi:Ca2+-binding EF-hand superfamily protein